MHCVTRRVSDVGRNASDTLVCRYGDWFGGHPQKCKVTDDLDVSVNIRTCGQCIMKFENAVRAVVAASTNATPPFIIFIFVNAKYLLCNDKIFYLLFMCLWLNGRNIATSIFLYVMYT